MSQNYRGYLCVIGGFLINFSLGTLYTFGNISPYISSYMKFVSKSSNVANADMVWIFAGALTFQGLTMSLGGFLNKKIGSRFASLIGCSTMSLAVILTYFTISVNIYLIILTYGVLFGVGTGTAYSVSIAASAKWFPHRRGLVIGIVVAGFGLGSLVFNQIQTLFINPTNISPNITIGADKYFGDLEMLKRVPHGFLLIGGIIATLQIIGCLLLFTPTIVKVKIVENESMLTSIKGEEVDKKSLASETCIYPNDTSPLQVLKLRDFWLLWFTFVLTGVITVLTTSLYKSFGQLFISSDYYLAIVGSIASIFNAGGRIFWGEIMDIFSYKFAMRIMTVLSTVLIGTFYCCSLVENKIGAQVMHLTWVCSILVNICGIYSMMPAAIAKLFGVENVGTIFGMLFTANAMASIIGAVATSFLLGKIGYLGIFELGAGMTFIAFILTFLHSSKNL